MTPHVSPGWGGSCHRHMVLQACLAATPVPGRAGPGCTRSPALPTVTPSVTASGAAVALGTWTPQLGHSSAPSGPRAPPPQLALPSLAWLASLALPAVTPMGKPSPPGLKSHTQPHPSPAILSCPHPACFSSPVNLM